MKEMMLFLDMSGKVYKDTFYISAEEHLEMIEATIRIISKFYAFEHRQVCQIESVCTLK